MGARLEADVHSLVDRLSWDDLRNFALVARGTSVRGAARIAGISAQTLLRSIRNLEEALGFRLLDRMPEGVRLTDRGRGVLDVVDQMRGSAQELDRAVRDRQSGRTFVSITVTQGLAMSWLVRKAETFMVENPHVGLDFRLSNDVADVLRFDSDIGVEWAPPTVADIVAIRCGRMHFELFASKSYLDAFGRPSSMDDLREHRFVEHVDGHVGRGHLTELFGHSLDIRMKVRGTAGLIAAVESGIGIGLLPTCSLAFGTRVVPLGLPIRKARDIWVTFRGGSRQDAAVSSAIDWLKDMVDGRRYPAFGTEYVPPEAIDPM